MRDATLCQMSMQEECVILRSHAAEGDAAECFVGLQHSRLRTEALHMTHAWNRFKGGNQRVIYHDGLRLGRAQSLVVHYLDMSAEARDFTLYLPFESQDDKDTQQHDGHAQSYARRRNLYGGTRDTASSPRMGKKSLGYEPCICLHDAE